MSLILLCLVACTAGASPIFLYSHDSNLLAGRNSYIDSKATDSTHQNTLVSTTWLNPKTTQTPSSLFSLVLLVDESMDTFATTTNWLKEEFVTAPSSVVVPQYTRNITAWAKQTDQVYLTRTTNYAALAQEIEHTLLESPTVRTFIVHVASLKNTGTSW